MSFIRGAVELEARSSETTGPSTARFALRSGGQFICGISITYDQLSRGRLKGSTGFSRPCGTVASTLVLPRTDVLGYFRVVPSGLDFRVGGAALSRDRDNDNIPDVVRSSFNLPQASQKARNG